MTAGTGTAPGAGRDGTGPQQITAAAAAVRARRAKARAACAAALLRRIYYLVVHDAAWDPAAPSGAAATPAKAA